jgi:hypothetical protein
MLREINKSTKDQQTEEDRSALHDEQAACFHELKYSRKKGARACARRPERIQCLVGMTAGRRGGSRRVS